MIDSTPENNANRNGLVITPEQPADPPATDARERLSQRRHLKAVEAARIHATPPTRADVVYMAREFIVCTLPHSDPGNVLAWSRTNGNYTLAITTGINAETKAAYGIPYGIIPRLLLVWIVTEITRTKSRRLELGNTLSEFLEKLGLSSYTGRGPRGDARRVREQMEKLFHASIQLTEILKGDGMHGSQGEKINIASKWGFWWSDENTEKGVLLNSYVEVSEELFKAIIKSPNPLDIRVLRHIKDSSLGIDLYTILNREAFRAMQENKPRFVAWEWLHEQTGNEYTGENGLKNFRRKALEQIEAILAAHSGLIIKIVKGRDGQKSGLDISNLSCPSIPPEELRRPAQPPIEATAQPVPVLAPVQPSPRRHLRPATVEKFRALYPHLGPYDCQTAFDGWQAGLPPEGKARHYDAAFLGFAKEWAKGK